MKNQNKAYVLLYTFYICASVFWIIGSIILLKRIQTDIHSQINQTWEQCILTDYRERLSNVPNKNIRKIQNALLEYERLELEPTGHTVESLTAWLVPGRAMIKKPYGNVTFV